MRDEENLTKNFQKDLTLVKESHSLLLLLFSMLREGPSLDYTVKNLLLLNGLYIIDQTSHMLLFEILMLFPKKSIIFS